jgi:hypothetical protein
MIAPIDDRDPHGRSGQTVHRFQSAETGAHHDDVVGGIVDPGRLQHALSSRKPKIGCVARCR